MGLVPVTDDVRRTGGGGLQRAPADDDVKVGHCNDVRRATAAATVFVDGLTIPTSSSSSIIINIINVCRYADYMKLL